MSFMSSQKTIQLRLFSFIFFHFHFLYFSFFFNCLYILFYYTHTHRYVYHILKAFHFHFYFIPYFHSLLVYSHFLFFCELSSPSTHEKSRNGAEETKTWDDDVEMLSSSRMWVSQSVPVNQFKAKLDVAGNPRVLLGVV